MSATNVQPTGITGQFQKNLISNIVFFASYMLIGLLLVPYFVDTLGVAAYGIIPLATSFTGYVGLVTQSLNSAVSRYLTVDLQKGDMEKANLTYNTAIFGTLGLIILFIPIMIVVSYYAPLFFEIPLNQEKEVSLLFLGVIGAFFIRSWSSNFMVIFFANNRLDIQNFINFINLFFQVAFILLFFTILSPQLSYIGYSYFVGALIALIITMFLAKKMNPELTVNIRFFDRSRVRDLSSMGGWITIDQIGTLLFLQIDLLVVNKLFGPVAGGEYALVLQWVILLRSISGTIAGVLTPVIFTYYAKNLYEEIVRLTRSAVKFMGLIMALPIALICGFAPVILSLWVGPEFAFLAPLMWVLTFHHVFNLAVLPLFPINVSFNRVRAQGTVTLLMGFGNLLLAISLPLITGWGYYGVAVAGAIMLTLKNIGFIPLYVSSVLKIPRKTYYSSMLPGFISFIIMAAGIAVFSQYFLISGLLPLIIGSAVVSLVYVVVIWNRWLNTFERNLIESFIPLNIRKYLGAIQ